MFNTLLLPRGPASKVMAYVGPVGSLVFNTETVAIHIQDGTTVGGIVLSKVGHSHAPNEIAAWLGYTPAALGPDGLVLASQLPAGSGGSGGSGTANLSLSPGSHGATYNNITGVLSLDGISGPLRGLTALIDATTTPLTVAVGGTLTASTFLGNGSGLVNLAADALSTGFVPKEVLGTGTADNTTFLRGDGVWISLGASGNLVDRDIINALGYTPAMTVNGIVPTSQLFLTTDDIPQGLNTAREYYSTSKAQNAISINAGNTGITYSSGLLDFTQMIAPSVNSFQVTSALGYTPAQIDPITGKVLSSQIPRITLNTTWAAPTEAAMLALAATKGDIAIRSDIQQSFVLSTNDPTVLANWTELLNPSQFVVSVNGVSGTDININTSVIPEGSRLYFTPGRAAAAISIVAGSTGVTYSNGVLNLTALESSSAILQAVANTPQPQVHIAGLYGGNGGANNGQAQLYFVAATGQADFRIWEQSATGSGLHFGTWDDNLITYTSMLSMNPVTEAVSINAQLTGVRINGDLIVSGGVLGVTADQFNGKFYGDGTNITGLKATALVGQIPSGNMGSSGTPNSTTILYGDGVWRIAPPGDGSLTLENVDAHARAAISLNAGTSGITYNQTTGVFDSSGIVVGLTTINGIPGTAGAISLTTDNIPLGTTNRYYTDTLARKSITLTPGVSGATYDNATGILDLSQIGAGNVGTVTTIAVATANGVSGTVTNPTSTPVITIILGDITPHSVTSTGNLTGGTVNSTGTLTAGNAVINGGITLTGALTGGTISSKILPRSQTTAGGSSFTPPADTIDLYTITNIANPFTVANPTGTPLNGQRLVLYFLDTGTAQAITWGTAYNGVGAPLPLFTVASKAMYVQCIYNSSISKWDVIGVDIASQGGYEVPISITGTIPSVGAKVLNFVITRPFALPANLTGSFAKSGVAAAAAVVFTISKNGSSVGSINFASGASTGTFTFASNVAFAAGDLMTVTAGTADSSLADIAINLLGV